MNQQPLLTPPVNREAGSTWLVYHACAQLWSTAQGRVACSFLLLRKQGKHWNKTGRPGHVPRLRIRWHETLGPRALCFSGNWPPIWVCWYLTQCSLTPWLGFLGSQARARKKPLFFPGLLMLASGVATGTSQWPASLAPGLSTSPTSAPASGSTQALLPLVSIFPQSPSAHSRTVIE